MYDTATQAAGYGLDTKREPKPLESLATAVQRVNSATVTISRFLERWHGPTPEPVEGTAAAAEQIVPHAGNLDRLFSALDRLETRLDTLVQIG